MLVLPNADPDVKAGELPSNSGMKFEIFLTPFQEWTENRASIQKYPKNRGFPHVCSSSVEGPTEKNYVSQCLQSKNQSKDQVFPLIDMTESSLAWSFLKKNFPMSKK